MSSLKSAWTSFPHSREWSSLVKLNHNSLFPVPMYRCDSDHVLIEVDKTTGAVYLKGLKYSAIDYASHNRAVDVSFDLELGPYQKQSYNAGIQDVDYDRFALILKVPFSSSLYRHFNSSTIELKASAHFEINHQYYRGLHNAIELASTDVLNKLVISSCARSLCRDRIQVSGKKIEKFVLDGRYQLAALRQMLSCSPDAPYLLLGPFGTGKTYVLAAAVAKLMESSNHRVLVCTHLNRGADGLYNNLQNNAPSTWQTVVRLVPSEEAADKLRLNRRTASVAIVSEVQNSWNQWPVIVTTFGTALRLAEQVKQSQVGWNFTHILIDEGAQCPEPEALGAFTLAGGETKIIIVGDNKQVLDNGLHCFYILHTYIVTAFLIKF